MNVAEQDLANDVAGWVVAREGTDIANRLAVALAHLHFYAATLPAYAAGAWTEVLAVLDAHVSRGNANASDHRLVARLRAVAPADPDAGSAADR